MGVSFRGPLLLFAKYLDETMKSVNFFVLKGLTEGLLWAWSVLNSLQNKHYTSTKAILELMLFLVSSNCYKFISVITCESDRKPRFV